MENIFDMDINSELIEERSHSLLNFSFRMAINKNNGHLLKIVFDLKREDVHRIGSHDDTNPITDKNERKNIKDHIRKTGFNDFTSYGTVKAIIDMDTNEHLTSASAVGIMCGRQDISKLSLAEREKIAKNGNFVGANRYVVGEKEDDEEPPTYKGTRPARNVDDLIKFQKERTPRGISKNIYEYNESGDIRDYIDDDGMTDEEFLAEQPIADVRGINIAEINHNGFLEGGNEMENILDTVIEESFTEIQPESDKVIVESSENILDTEIDEPITESKHIDMEKSGYRKVNQGPINKDQKAGECKHKWLYGGGACWCGKCGLYLQPDNRVTTTPGGRGGRVVEVLNESTDEKLDNNYQKILSEITANDNNVLMNKRYSDNEIKLFEEYTGKGLSDKAKKYWEFFRSTEEEMFYNHSSFDICGNPLCPTEYGDEDKVLVFLSSAFSNDDPCEIVYLKHGDDHIYMTEFGWSGGSDTPTTRTISREYKTKITLDSFITSDLWLQYGPLERDELEKEIDDYFKDDKSITESAEDTDVSAEQTLSALAKSIMNGTRITASTMNTIANTITNNLLSKWSHGFNKVNIKLLPNNSNIDFEFIPPQLTAVKNVTNEFIKRFIDGNESLTGFLHRTPEINIGVSERIFKNLKSERDLPNLFRNAIKYYDFRIDKGGNELAHIFMKLDNTTKQLLAGPLNSVVVYSLNQLFIFRDITITAANNAFKVNRGLIKTVNKFVSDITTTYSKPAEEKAKVVADLTKSVESLIKNVSYTENVRSIRNMPDGIKAFYNSGFDDQIKTITERFEFEQLDTVVNAVAFNEKTTVKRLKKIPSDLVAYITIEGEAIRDANDKMMIVSYAYGKLEIIEWYIELLEVGSKNYIVPHSKSYLETLRTQILQAIKTIMAVKIKSPDDPIINVTYPKGYEG